MSGKYTDAQKRASVKYLAEKTDDVRLRLPKGTKERWSAVARAHGKSLTQFVKDAVEAAVAATDLLGQKPGD